MAISVTVLKNRCLEIIRQVEERGQPVDVTRRGELVARIIPSLPRSTSETKPWERLRGCGRLLSAAEESVLEAADFDAWR